MYTARPVLEGHEMYQCTLDIIGDSKRQESRTASRTSISFSPIHSGLTF